MTSYGRFIVASHGFIVCAISYTNLTCEQRNGEYKRGALTKTKKTDRGRLCCLSARKMQTGRSDVFDGA